MPCNYNNYPPDWKTKIRPDILERADNCCEICGLRNKDTGYRAVNGDFYKWNYIEDALEIYGHDLFDDVLSHHIKPGGKISKAIRIVLTISHTDHDITNNDYSNLKALCQLHHLRHDIGHHKETRKKNRGLQNLF